MTVSKTAGYEQLHLVKKSPTAAKCIALEFYPTSTDIAVFLDWCDEVTAHHGVRYWAVKLHDEDLKEDGHLADPHYHAVLWLRNEKDATQAAKWLVKTQCPAVRPVNPRGVVAYALRSDVASAVRYLCHLDQPEKHQYDPEEWCKQKTLMSDSEQTRKWCAGVYNNNTANSDLSVVTSKALYNAIISNRFETHRALLDWIANDPNLWRAYMKAGTIIDRWLREQKNFNAAERFEEDSKEWRAQCTDLDALRAKRYSQDVSKLDRIEQTAVEYGLDAAQVINFLAHL